MPRAFSRFAVIGAAFAAIVGFAVLITAQPGSKPSRVPVSTHRVGVPDDWSHHHLVFSNPGTYEQAAKTGVSNAKWLTIQYDTRFILQQMRRHAESTRGLFGMISPGGEQAASRSGMVEGEGLNTPLNSSQKRNLSRSRPPYRSRRRQATNGIGASRFQAPRFNRTPTLLRGR